MSKKKAKHLGQTAAKQATAITVTAPTAEPTAEPTVSQPTAEQSAQTANAAQNAQPTAVQNNTQPAPTEQSNAQLPSAAAEDLQDKIAELYSDELKRLYVFAARWQAALPTDDRSPESERRKALVAAIKEIISDNKTINTAEQGREIVARITDLLSCGGKPKTPSDTFDLNEVLNPGELDLETLCKELGVMD